jgi:hypothetical protein
MTNSSSPKTASSAYSKFLRLIALIFFVGWGFMTLSILFMGASWREIVGGIILFGGFGLAWAWTVRSIKAKHPEYFDGILAEDEKVSDQKDK